MIRRLAAALVVATMAGGAAGAPMAESLRPQARPGASVAGAPLVTPPHPAARPAPVAAEVARAAFPPAYDIDAATLAASRPLARPSPAVISLAAPGTSLRPALRPARPVANRTADGPDVVEQVVFRTQPVPEATVGREGAVCGDPAIIGKTIPPIAARLKGCGLDDGVSLLSVAGVALTQPASVDCTTARALKAWVEAGVKPAVGRKGGGVAALQIAASYSCRGRNNQKGAKISEHGRGRAVDISGVILADGTALMVEKAWGTKSYGKTLASMRKAACGPFTTVLGPGSDRYHDDHFHLDTARGRGAYCR